MKSEIFGRRALSRNFILPVAVAILASAQALSADSSASGNSGALPARQEGRLTEEAIDGKHALLKVEALEYKIESQKQSLNFAMWILSGIGAISLVVGFMSQIREFRADKRLMEAHKQTLELYQLQRTNLGHVNDVMAAVGQSTKANIEPINQVFQLISKILEVKVEESELSVKSQRLVETMQGEIDRLRSQRIQDLEELLNEANGLERYPRHAYEEPEDDLVARLLAFKWRMDGAASSLLKAEETKDSRFTPLFLRRGLIAYHDEDPVIASKMLLLAQTVVKGQEGLLDAKTASFIRFYLALLHRDYQNIKDAREHIDASFELYGKEMPNELLTRTVRAEIHYYNDNLKDLGSILDEARSRIDERVAANLLNARERSYQARILVVKGDTLLDMGDFSGANRNYREAGECVKENPYMEFAQGLACLKEGSPSEALNHMKNVLELAVRQSPYVLGKGTRQSLLFSSVVYLAACRINPKEAREHKQRVFQILEKITPKGEFRFKPYSHLRRRPVSIDAYRVELDEWIERA